MKTQSQEMTQKKDHILSAPDTCPVPRWQLLKNSLNNLSFEDFVEAYQNDPQGVCLDARTSEEFDTSHLPGAINIDYLSDTLADELEQLDTVKTYYVCCRSGRRGLRVCVLLTNMAYRVVNLRNGMRVYEKEAVKEQNRQSNQFIFQV